jgi:DMSO/TMAO reductase YedYZ molybdopterin-dependent catalytic subunit
MARAAAGAACLAALGIPDAEWAFQAGDELVSFTDYTDDFKVEASVRNPRVRCFDLRRLTSWTTPNNEFYTFHQTETVHAEAEPFRLRIGGFVDRPRELTLAEVMGRPDRRDEAVTLECSATRRGPSAWAAC